MKNLLLAVLMIIVAYSSMAISKNVVYSVDDIQGMWWSDCNDAAAEFMIDGSYYSGDFLGEYKVEVADNKLTLTKGFINGHSINVTGVPLVFEIVKLTRQSLHLNSVKDEYVWVLNSCEESSN